MHIYRHVLVHGGKTLRERAGEDRRLQIEVHVVSNDRKAGIIREIGV